jgi:hypothetical protein
MVAGGAASTVDGVARSCGGGWEWMGELERDRERGKARCGIWWMKPLNVHFGF